MTDATPFRITPDGLLIHEEGAFMLQQCKYVHYSAENDWLQIESPERRVHFFEGAGPAWREFMKGKEP